MSRALSVAQVREVVRFGTGSMTKTKYLVLDGLTDDELPGFYKAADVQLLRQGVQFHEFDFEQAGFDVYSRLHPYGR